MRVVLDTNTVVSGFLWENPPRRLIDAATEDRITLYTSEALIEELTGILPRPKFARRLAEKQLSIPALIERYRVLADIVAPALLSRAVSKDPDDNLVLATALAASSELIVSGDADLLTLGSFRNIRILTPQQVLSLLAERRG